VQKERKMMARFRCVNEKREKRYWMEGEEGRCRMCYEERETIQYTGMDVAKYERRRERSGEKY
jgi:hypothetical protein